MTRRGLPAAAALLIAATVALAGCGGKDEPPKPDVNAPLPAAEAVLKDSSASAATIESAHLVMRIKGDPPGISVRSVDGDIKRNGDAQGKIDGTMSGAHINSKFAVINGRAYLEFMRLEMDAKQVASIYDTKALLDPDRGIANLIAKTTDAKVVGRETVDGTVTLKVTGKATKEVLAPIVPGVESGGDVTYFFRDGGDKLPLKTWIQLPGEKSGTPTVETMLSEIGKQFTATKPK